MTAMTIEDKTFLLNICEMPRLGLSQQQIADIERVIDGRPAALPRVAVTYWEAAEMLGFKSKNSDKTIMKFVKEGRLERAGDKGSGRVTLESVKNFGKVAAV